MTNPATPGSTWDAGRIGDLITDTGKSIYDHAMTELRGMLDGDEQAQTILMNVSMRLAEFAHLSLGAGAADLKNIAERREVALATLKNLGNEKGQAALAAVERSTRFAVQRAFDVAGIIVGVAIKAAVVGAMA
jgi:hypothetical protein